MSMSDTFSRNVVEFTERFASEEACMVYLMSIRWPQVLYVPIMEDFKDGQWPEDELQVLSLRYVMLEFLLI